MGRTQIIILDPSSGNIFFTALRPTEEFVMEAIERICDEKKLLVNNVDWMVFTGTFEFIP